MNRGCCRDDESESGSASGAQVQLQCAQEQATRQNEADMAPRQKQAELERELCRSEAERQTEALRATTLAQVCIALSNHARQPAAGKSLYTQSPVLHKQLCTLLVVSPCPQQYLLKFCWSLLLNDGRRRERDPSCDYARLSNHIRVMMSCPTQQSH